MSKLKVEYLIHFDNQSKLCNSDNFLKTLLELNEELTIEANKITYRDIVVDYSIKLNKIDGGCFFELKIIYEDEDIQTRSESCHNLVSAINEVVYCLKNVQVYTLWNDLSFIYSKQAYPLIYEVENLMRKLITKFMVVNVGVQWSKTDLTDSIRSQAKNGKDKIDILYQLDFIHLSEVLLKSQKPKTHPEDIKRVYQKIMEANTSGELDINELKNLVPQSNWEKYFSALIQGDSAEIEKSWQKLYELRCKVAHNNFINKGDYKEILRLTEELKVKFQEALEKLDEVKVPEEDKKDIIENVNEDIVNQLREFDVNDFNLSQLIANNFSTGIFRTLRLTGGIGLAENQMSKLVSSLGLTENQISMLKLAGGIDLAENQMSKLVSSLGLTGNQISTFVSRKGVTSAPKTRVGETKAQVKDEVDTSLATVQNVKDEENL